MLRGEIQPKINSNKYAHEEKLYGNNLYFKDFVSIPGVRINMYTEN